ncbi:MAG: ATP-dependent Clp protease proteolytic subunit, partial [Chloroflexota bacterium]
MTPQSTLQPALFNTARASTLPQSSESTQVYVLTFEGAVTPVLDQYIADGIETATTQNAEALILQLDTPGGSVDITKSINQKILGSSVPVVVYVAPAGAHAGSAGTFITLAGHAAAMAPGSSIGAASPVGGGGEDIGETMEAKVTNILTADIENLASRRGEEATEWAIAAVEEAAAATAQQALDLGVIDFIVPNLSTLLDELDGFEVTVQGATQTLNTKNAFITRVELNSIQRF